MTKEFVTLPRELVKQALEALVRLGTDDVGRASWDFAEAGNACFALREALEQPKVEQEPVAWASPRLLEWDKRESEKVEKLTRKKQPVYGFTIPLYSKPHPRQIPLTDEQIMVACDAIGSTRLLVKIARAIERAHHINHEGEEA